MHQIKSLELLFLGKCTVLRMEISSFMKTEIWNVKNVLL